MKNKDKENKLKKFVKEHELAFTIAGGAVIFIAGAGLMYRGYRYSSIAKEAATNWLTVIEACQKGTRDTAISNLVEGVTVAEYFGKAADSFMAGSTVQPDDIVVNVIYNIAKKAET